MPRNKEARKAKTGVHSAIRRRDAGTTRQKSVRRFPHLSVRGVLRAITILVAALTLGRPAVAGAVYTTNASYSGIYGLIGSSQSDSDAIQAASSASGSGTDPLCCGANNLSAADQATASVAGLGSWSNAELSTPAIGVIPYGMEIGGSASAQANYDDFVISCILSSGCDSTISIALNLVTTGTVLTTANATLVDCGCTSNPPNDYADSAAQITVSGSVNGNGFTTTFNQSESDWVPQGVQDSSSVSNTNITGVLPGSTQELTTTYFTVPIGTPIPLSLELYTEAGVSDGANGDFGNTSTTVATADMDYYTTLSFPTSGPVFDLPPGYTVNSEEADIVDDSFILPAPPASPSSVPEPGTLALFGTALAGLGLLQRRRLSTRDAARG